MAEPVKVSAATAPTLVAPPAPTIVTGAGIAKQAEKAKATALSSPSGRKNVERQRTVAVDRTAEMVTKTRQAVEQLPGQQAQAAAYVESQYEHHRDRAERELEPEMTRASRDSGGFLRLVTKKFAELQANMKTMVDGMTAAMSTQAQTLGNEIMAVGNKTVQLVNSLTVKGLYPTGSITSDLANGGLHWNDVYINVPAVLLSLILMKASRYIISDVHAAPVPGALTSISTYRNFLSAPAGSKLEYQHFWSISEDAVDAYCSDVLFTVVTTADGNNVLHDRIYPGPFDAAGAEIAPDANGKVELDVVGDADDPNSEGARYYLRRSGVIGSGVDFRAAVESAVFIVTSGWKKWVGEVYALFSKDLSAVVTGSAERDFYTANVLADAPFTAKTIDAAVRGTPSA